MKEAILPFPFTFLSQISMGLNYVLSFYRPLQGSTLNFKKLEFGSEIICGIVGCVCEIHCTGICETFRVFFNCSDVCHWVWTVCAIDKLNLGTVVIIVLFLVILFQGVFHVFVHLDCCEWVQEENGEEILSDVSFNNVKTFPDRGSGAAAVDGKPNVARPCQVG